MPSIRRRLLRNLLAVGALLCALTGAVVAYVARSQVGDLLDYQLEQVARTLIDRDLNEIGTRRADDPAWHLELRISDVGGQVLYSTDGATDFPATTPPGLTTIADPDADEDEGLRVFTLRSASRVVQVFQPVSLRQELAWEAAAAAVIPSLLLLVALSFLIVATIRRELAPLARLGAELEARGADALTPIDLPEAPDELRVPVLTLNRLLRRIADGIRSHRDFVADAAHELRSPLTAIRVHAANVASAQDDVQRRESVRHLTNGVDRLSHLVQQLLTLAQLEPSARPARRDRLDLKEIARQCLVDQVGASAAKGMQLSLVADEAAWVIGDGEALRVMLDNLVGNAIKYAPEGSPVDIAVATDGSGVRVTVRDRGPGIPSGERARVFDRFHRLAGSTVAGSGLGLAIVAAAVSAHHGSVELADPTDGPGLLVTVRIPAPGDADRAEQPSRGG